MELALVRESASCEQGGRGVRIKLHFEDRSILSPEQLLEGLSDSWFLLRPHLRSIADLAADIGSAFHLLKACPHGVFLRMEDFTLPPSQPVWLLKDKDVVSVNKKGVPINSAHQGIKHGNGSSLNTFDKIWLAGVNPHAIEEFERETGGYESEEEEDAQGMPHEDLGDMAKSPEISSRKSKQKKRKRDESERVAEQEGSLKLQVVPYTGGHTGKKEKKSKKQRLIMQQNDKEENVFAADEMQKCQKDKKARELGTSKANGSRKQKRVTAIGSRNDVASDSEDPTVKKHGAKNGIHKNATLSSSSSGEQLQDEEKKPVLQVEGESVKKPSRSTLRKKAKRRWKREHDGEALATKNIEKPTDGRSKTAAYSDTTKPLSLAFPTKHEDDGEAEEERLPLVVRPGHIRFEPLDEDDDDSLHAQHTLPLLGWNNGISKRKGQSWGQEKARRGGKNLIGSDDMEICNSQAIEFETLPPLAMAPQNGDVVAYRLLELTPSLCPEVSEYRVGKVVDLENHSGILKLAEVPKYPLRRRPEYQDAETDRDIDFPSSYDKEGFLETQLSSLVDIRLVEGGSLDTHNIESRIQVPTELAIMNSCTNYSTEATPLLSDTKAEVSKNLVIIPNSSKACSPTKQKPDIPYSAWQEISKELDRKKEELTRREGITSTSLQTRATELGKFKNESGSSCGGNTRKETSTGRSKTWRKRADGLGSIVALLRSENVV